MNKLGILIKKDLKALLPSYAGFVMGALALTLISIPGSMSGNGNFALTTLYVFFFAMIIAAAFTAVKCADTFRKNLTDSVYQEKLKKEGIGKQSFLLLKLAEAAIMQLLLITEYVILFYISLMVSWKRIGNGGEIGSGILVTSGESRADKLLNFIILYLEEISVALAFTALAFLAFSLCFRFFLREKYAFGASLLTLITMFWVVFKLFDLLTPDEGIMAGVGTIIFALTAGAALTIIYVSVMQRETAIDL